MSEVNPDRSYAISVFDVVGYNAGGVPVPSVECAQCHYCDRWATQLRTSASKDGPASDEPFTKRFTSRYDLVVIYVCDHHGEEADAALLRIFGHASNTYEPDPLATKVDRYAQLVWEGHHPKENN